MDVLCIPGDRICDSKGHIAGRGTYVDGNSIYASAMGEVCKSMHSTEPPIIDVSVEIKTESRIRPRVGCQVTCRVSEVHWLHANLHILCVEDSVLPVPIPARLRREDIVSIDRDSVYVGHCVRVGDIILAKVLSVEDRRQWRVSTAETDLGVVVGRSRVGEVMLPLSWTEMKCPNTGEIEKRKVSRIMTELPNGDNNAINS